MLPVKKKLPVSRTVPSAAARTGVPSRRGDVHAGVRIARLVIEDAPQAKGTRAHARNRLQQPQRCRRRGAEGGKCARRRVVLARTARQILLGQIHLARRHLERLGRVLLVRDLKLECSLGRVAAAHGNAGRSGRRGQGQADNREPARRSLQHQSAIAVKGDDRRRRRRLHRAARSGPRRARGSSVAAPGGAAAARRATNRR